MNIGDLFFVFRSDGSNQLELDAKKSGEAAGIAGSKSFSQTFGSSLKRAAGGMLGAGIGAGIGVMVTGANQLDAATRQLQADTGMTADEAKRAQGALASMYRGNLQGFDAIGAAMAKVHNDLGLIGDEADAATERFLKFSTATGIDAAQAVSLFDDALDNWGLTAADTQMVMDKVIVSHQKWGGEIEANLVTLAKVAPAMRAANFTIDDGIALLGLFGAKGLDSERAAAAFAKALTKVKSPAELQWLITDISQTKDPFERAAKAADLFGAKAGAQLANALGGVAIGDFTVSMEDAAGATDKAADAIESGFGAQFQLLLKNATGALAEFGQNFGGLLLVASAFGPAFLTKMGAALGGIAGFFGPKLLAMIAPRATATGLASGGLMGTAFGAGFAAAAVIAVGAAFVTVKDAIDAQGKALGEQAATWAATATADQLRAAKAANERAKMELASQVMATSVLLGPLAALATQGARDALDKTGREIDAGLARVGAATVTGIRNGFVTGAPAVLDAAEDLGKAIPPAVAAGVRLTATKESISPAEVFGLFGSSVEGVKAAAHSTGIAGMEAMAAGITAARSKPIDAFTTMKEMLKNAMTPTQEAARLAGELTSAELAAGLRSKDPAVKAQAIAVRRTIIDRLEEIAKDSGGIGKGAMAELEKGMKSEDAHIRNAAIAARKAVLDELNGTTTGARTAGANAGASFARGMLSRIPSFLRKAIEAQLHAAGTPGYATGAWEIPTDQLAFVHRREMIIPAAEATAVRSGQAAVTAQGLVGGGAREQHINIEHVEIRDAHDEFSLTQQLRFLAAVG